MTRKEFIESLKSAQISSDVSLKVLNVYSNAPDIILKILSLFQAPELFDENESRTLSINEVLHAEEINDVPFRSKDLIPIVDLGNNDYIVYNTAQGSWYLYNTVDEILFDKEPSFENLFLR